MEVKISMEEKFSLMQSQIHALLKILDIDLKTFVETMASLEDNREMSRRLAKTTLESMQDDIKNASKTEIETIEKQLKEFKKGLDV